MVRITSDRAGEPMHPRWLAALVAAVVLTAAGCGGSGSSGGIASLDAGDEGATATTAATGTTMDQEQAMLDFAQCMRDQGIDMADPTVDANGNFQMMRPSGSGEGGEFNPADREAMQAARDACTQYLEGITQGFDRPDMTEMQDLMLQYAACMREHGVDMPDPDFSTTDDAGGPGGRLGFDSGAFDPSDPTFQAANEACQSIFGANGMPGFMGGGFGGQPPGAGTPPDEGTPPDQGTTPTTNG
jgi:hypothetical protein